MGSFSYCACICSQQRAKGHVSLDGMHGDLGCLSQALGTSLQELHEAMQPLECGFYYCHLQDELAHSLRNLLRDMENQRTALSLTTSPSGGTLKGMAFALSGVTDSPGDGDREEKWLYLPTKTFAPERGSQ